MDLYWVGGTASANATAGSKWSLTSGGAGGQPIPTTSDDVFFDGASGAVIITIATGFACRSLNCTGFTGIVAGSGAYSLFGSLTYVAGMTLTYTGTITFGATSGTNTITTAGKSIGGNFTFNGVGGTWQLQDNLTITTGKGITLTNGTLDRNGKNISTGNFVSNNSNVRSLLISGSGTITLIDTGTVWNFATTTNLTLTATGSTIIISDVSATSKTFAGGGKTYGTITVTGDNVIISGANTFALNLNNAGLTTGLVLTAGVTQTVTAITTNGSAGNLAKIVSSSSGSPATISKSSGTVSLDYVSIKDSTASGGASFYAGANSTNVSGNTGWIFTAPPVPGASSGSFFFTS